MPAERGWRSGRTPARYHHLFQSQHDGLLFGQVMAVTRASRAVIILHGEPIWSAAPLSGYDAVVVLLTRPTATSSKAIAASPPDKLTVIGHDYALFAESREYETTMARSSPGVRRIVSILNFFADHPGQSFTLTDLVRALKLSRATCHALLTGLVESGYLYRTHDKSYVIGPTLVSIGRIAQQHLSPVQVAQPEMRALADQFDAICSAIYLEGNEVVVRARAAAISHLGWSSPQGARMLLRAPFAAAYFAWSPKSEADAWLAQAVPAPTPEQRGAMFEAMAFAREHGYCFHVRNPRVTEPPATPELAFVGERTEFPTILPSEIKADESYSLASVIAPVFEENNRVAFVLGLMGFGGKVSGDRIEKMGHRLREACDRITVFVSGKRP